MARWPRWIASSTAPRSTRTMGAAAFGIEVSIKMGFRPSLDPE
jgi:hypothetical protein